MLPSSKGAGKVLSRGCGDTERCLVVSSMDARESGTMRAKTAKQSLLRKEGVLVHRNLTEASEQPFGAGGHDSCFRFAGKGK